MDTYSLEQLLDNNLCFEQVNLGEKIASELEDLTEVVLLCDANQLADTELTLLAKKYLQAEELVTFTARKALTAKKEFIGSRLWIKYLGILFLMQRYSSEQKAAGVDVTLIDFKVLFNEQLASLQLYYLGQLLPITVSISHSHGQLLIAFMADKAKIGVDIELFKEKRAINTLAEEFYHAEEADLVNLNGERAFYRLWTLKEALAKASGQGVADLLHKETVNEVSSFFVASNQYMLDSGDDAGFTFDISIVSQSSLKSTRVTQTTIAMLLSVID